MELLCNAPAHAAVPDRYVFPPEKRAAQSLHDDGVSLPVVDLHRAALAGDEGLRRRVAAEIVQAGKDFGFFQARRAHLVNLTLHRELHYYTGSYQNGAGGYGQDYYGYGGGGGYQQGHYKQQDYFYPPQGNTHTVVHHGHGHGY